VTYFPEVATTGYHLLHGGSTRFHEWVIPVPRGWWTFKHDESLIVQKIRQKAADDPIVVIGPFTLAQGSVFNQEKSKTALIKTEAGRGYKFLTQNIVNLGLYTGVCFWFAARENSHRLSTTCVIPEGKLSVTFVGDQNYRTEFNEIIGHMKFSQ
jgi:hypothetical protein